MRTLDGRAGTSGNERPDLLRCDYELRTGRKSRFEDRFELTFYAIYALIERVNTLVKPPDLCQHAIKPRIDSIKPGVKAFL